MQATFKVCEAGMSKHDVVDRLRKEEQTRDLTFEYCLITAGTSRNRAPSNQRLKPGDMISLNFGGNFHGYIGDLCRIGYPGQPDAQLKELLQEVEEIQQVARKVIRPGTAGGEIVSAGEAAVKSSRIATSWISPPMVSASSVTKRRVSPITARYRTRLTMPIVRCSRAWSSRSRRRCRIPPAVTSSSRIR